MMNLILSKKCMILNSRKHPIQQKQNEISPHIRILTRYLRRFDLIKFGFKHAANLGLAAKRADVHLLVYYLTTTVKKALPSATLFLILILKPTPSTKFDNYSPLLQIIEIPYLLSNARKIHTPYIYFFKGPFVFLANFIG
ncbi:hypothetical protein J2Y73_004694 [Peribacillus frigoritolerans]|uniref:hypothetical protein n=1 Tax=Peribacillus frigoritolerans TaxID=450367 RepID=UPI00209F2270|nr:hypothetical protein [Peribacillus frigoritolerans]MCP1494663.1 hypothetical protein [Peribacillus frigoritolerans]